ncbi:hypothetical protein ACOSQ4_012492 [Xanthoceras sorbifolium]
MKENLCWKTIFKSLEDTGLGATEIPIFGMGQNISTGANDGGVMGNLRVAQDTDDRVLGLNNVNMDLTMKADAHATSSEALHFNCPGPQTLGNKCSTFDPPTEGSQSPSCHVAVSLVKAEAKKRWKRLARDELRGQNGMALNLSLGKRLVVDFDVQDSGTKKKR